MIYYPANFDWNQCIPSKVIAGNNTVSIYFTQILKTKSKKGHNLTKIMWTIPNIKLDLYFTIIYPSANFQWNQCIPAKFNEQKLISTQQQKVCRKRAITRPKFCNWLLTSNLTSILQWYILLQTSNEIKVSLQNLLNWKQYLNPTTKTTSKKGHNSAKIWCMITNIEKSVFFIDINICILRMKCIPSNVVEQKQNVWRHRQCGQTTWSLCICHATRAT